MDGVADSCVSATAHWGAVRAGALGRAGGGAGRYEEIRCRAATTAPGSGKWCGMPSGR